MTEPDRVPVRKVPSQTSLSLVRAGTVVTSGPGGDLEEGTFHGIYHRDLRLLSRYDVSVDGVRPNVLRSARRDASSLDTVMATSFDAHGDARAVLVRHRCVTGSVEDRYELHRLAPGPPMTVRIRIAADFAPLMSVKAGTGLAPGQPLTRITPERFELHAPTGTGVSVTIDGDAPEAEGDTLQWQVDLAVGDRWDVRITIAPHPEPSAASAELTAPGPLRVGGSDHRWGRAIQGAVADLASLRMQVDGERFTAAGAPWFMALFGRDALFTAQAALPLGTDAALDTLEALAGRQGRQVVARTLEEPGRILHELRVGASGVFGLDPGEPYFGAADTTPLFVVVLADAARWGADPARVGALLPAARRAVEWCHAYGDVDGDGFVEAVPHEGGIENQGWKDSGDSMVHVDGQPAPRPIALVEVQAYVYGALIGLAELEERLGDPEATQSLRQQAAELRRRFVAAFWSDRLGSLAMGLDAHKRPLEVASSNMGHALWTGILPTALRPAVVQRVTSSDLFASWGIRTLGSDEVAYSPLAYHRGTIWPHDTAIIAHGLARAGARTEVRSLREELLDLAEHSEYRLPELLGGTGRDELPAPVPYPVACSPQAWSAAAPLLLLRAVLGLEPDVPGRQLSLLPVLDEGEALRVTGIRLGASEVTIEVDGTDVKVEGADHLVVRVGSD